MYAPIKIMTEQNVFFMLYISKTGIIFSNKHTKLLEE